MVRVCFVRVRFGIFDTIEPLLCKDGTRSEDIVQNQRKAIETLLLDSLKPSFLLFVSKVLKVWKSFSLGPAMLRKRLPYGYIHNHTAGLAAPMSRAEKPKRHLPPNKQARPLGHRAKAGVVSVDKC